MKNNDIKNEALRRGMNAFVDNNFRTLDLT